MVYVQRWEDFTLRATRVYGAEPNKTRYCIKWRHNLGLLVLKVTDDTNCIKFKTRSSLYLNRFETLTRTMLELQQNTASATTTTKNAMSEGKDGAGTADGRRAMEKGVEDEGAVPAVAMDVDLNTRATAKAKTKKKKKKGGGGGDGGAKK